MTRLAVGFGRGFPRMWLLPIGALTVVLGVAATGHLSRSIVADLIAWWPVWTGLVVAAVLLREKKVGHIRVSGLIPLAGLLLVLLFFWGHVAGWPIMPSAAQRLVGPEVGSVETAALTADIDGRLDVAGGAEYLYRVEPVMGGGRIGIPGASEQVVDSSVSVMLEAPSNPGLYSYAGWDITLANTPRWSLSLSGAIDADLSSSTLDALEVAGSGIVRLGGVSEETPVSVDGSFRIVVPPDTAARVIGVASVPASWALDDQGAASPTAGAGWVITVTPDASVRVSEG